LLFLAAAVAAQAQFTLTTNNGTITITAYTGSGASVVIPSTTNGLPVTSIGPTAFEDYPYGNILTNITIPNSITNIGDRAFQSCNALLSITIPGSVISIGSGAFNSCQKLSSVTFANGVTSIGTNMFAGCDRLTSVTIPNSVISIEDGAFDSCIALTAIIIPGSVTSIGSGAFSLSYGLSSAYFLGNAPSLGGGVFEVDRMTVYYQPFTTGWSNTFDGWPTAPWIPPLPAPGIATYSNQPVVFFPLTIIGTNFEVQMTTNLASGNWVAVTNGIPFIGVQISNAPSPAFFRIQ
jgi:hypothetical protein